MYGVKVSTLLRFMDYFISFPVSLHGLSAQNGLKPKKEGEVKYA